MQTTLGNAPCNDEPLKQAKDSQAWEQWPRCCCTILQPENESSGLWCATAFNAWKMLCEILKDPMTIFSSTFFMWKNMYLASCSLETDPFTSSFKPVCQHIYFMAVLWRYPHILDTGSHTCRECRTDITIPGRGRAETIIKQGEKCVKRATF